MQKVYLDIMVADRFYCQLPYEHCPLFAVKTEELISYVERKRPTLKGKKYRIIPTLQRA